MRRRPNEGRPTSSGPAASPTVPEPVTETPTDGGLGATPVLSRLVSIEGGLRAITDRLALLEPTAEATGALTVLIRDLERRLAEVGDSVEAALTGVPGAEGEGVSGDDTGEPSGTLERRLSAIALEQARLRKLHEALAETTADDRQALDELRQEVDRLSESIGQLLGGPSLADILDVQHELADTLVRLTEEVRGLRRRTQLSAR